MFRDLADLSGSGGCQIWICRWYFTSDFLSLFDPDPEENELKIYALNSYLVIPFFNELFVQYNAEALKYLSNKAISWRCPPFEYSLYFLSECRNSKLYIFGIHLSLENLGLQNIAYVSYRNICISSFRISTKYYCQVLC